MFYHYLFGSEWVNAYGGGANNTVDVRRQLARVVSLFSTPCGLPDQTMVSALVTGLYLHCCISEATTPIMFRITSYFLPATSCCYMNMSILLPRSFSPKEHLVRCSALSLTEIREESSDKGMVTYHRNCRTRWTVSQLELTGHPIRHKVATKQLFSVSWFHFYHFVHSFSGCHLALFPSFWKPVNSCLLFQQSSFLTMKSLQGAEDWWNFLSWHA